MSHTHLPPSGSLRSVNCLVYRGSRIRIAERPGVVLRDRIRAEAHRELMEWFFGRGTRANDSSCPLWLEQKVGGRCTLKNTPAL